MRNNGLMQASADSDCIAGDYSGKSRIPKEGDCLN